ncbi:hypothetical protein DA469_21915 [Bacillus subtilis]|nr:hypothetical protein DA469_21915 [Bacillus subtilis]
MYISTLKKGQTYSKGEKSWIANYNIGTISFMNLSNQDIRELEEAGILTKVKAVPHQINIWYENELVKTFSTKISKENIEESLKRIYKENLLKLGVRLKDTATYNFHKQDFIFISNTDHTHNIEFTAIPIRDFKSVKFIIENEYDSYNKEHMISLATHEIE